MSEWYKDWFESEFYLDVYSHRNEEDAKRIVDLILKKTNLRPNAKILDSSCGNGRHSILFADNGFEVIGFDLSKNLLDEAKKKSGENNLRIKLIRADIRNFYVNEKFDLVINLFTSFGYFENDDENFSFFDKALSMMKENASFVFDYLNYDFVVNTLIEHDYKEYKKLRIKQTRSIINDRIEKQITLTEGEQITTFKESVKLYRKQFLLKKFQEIGFEIVEVLGDYSGNIFDELNSPRLIIIMKR